MAEIREAFKMPFFQKKKNDNYQTPIEYLRVIDEHISSGQLINDPFYCQHKEGGGLVKRNWCKLGRHIIHNDCDFFTEQEFDKTDCIVSNPPFSLIFQILEKLFELDTPFALLLPLQKIAQIKIQSRQGICQKLKRIFEKKKKLIYGNCNFLCVIWITN